MEIAVVGGGVMGLHVAHYCLRRNWSVTVYDQGPVPNPLGSGYDRHRLIRFPYGELAGYSRLVHQAYAGWRDVFERLPSGTTFHEETGTLSVGRRNSRWIQGSAHTLQEMGISFDILDSAKMSRRYPHMRMEADECGLYTESGGVLLADRILEALATELNEHGARVESHEKVLGVEPKSSTRSFVNTVSSSKAYDHVFVTTGAWPRPGGTDAGLLLPPVVPSRQILAYPAHPPTWMPNAMGPILLDLDRKGELYVVPGIQGTGIKAGTHTFSHLGHPDDLRQTTDEERHQLIDQWTSRFPGDETMREATFRACYYATTDDGRLFLHQHGNVTHIGGGNGHAFKFAPVIGNVAASIAASEMSAEGANRLLRGEC